MQQSNILPIDYLTFEVNYRLLKIKPVASCRKTSQQQMIHYLLKDILLFSTVAHGASVLLDRRKNVSC